MYLTVKQCQNVAVVVLQVWQNILQLWEYKRSDDFMKSINSLSAAATTLLHPTKRCILCRNAAAAIFIKYGFDKEGLMPYAGVQAKGIRY